MDTERPALGEMLEDLVKLGAIEFRPEPLDGIVERRLVRLLRTRKSPRRGELIPILE